MKEKDWTDFRINTEAPYGLIPLLFSAQQCYQIGASFFTQNGENSVKLII